MPDDEINSAEAEAEEILKQELAKAEADNCPKGDDCPVHHRVDEEIIDDETQYGRIITYDGEYAVITTDNPQLESPQVILSLILGKLSKSDLPDFFETAVLHVGDGVLGDLKGESREIQKAAIRFVQTHNDWNNFKNAHESIVSALGADMIDVSRSVYDQEK